MTAQTARTLRRMPATRHGRKQYVDEDRGSDSSDSRLSADLRNAGGGEETDLLRYRQQVAPGRVWLEGYIGFGPRMACSIVSFAQLGSANEPQDITTCEREKNEIHFTNLFLVRVYRAVNRIIVLIFFSPFLGLSQIGQSPPNCQTDLRSTSELVRTNHWADREEARKRPCPSKP
jgi:hypothetical protein